MKLRTFSNPRFLEQIERETLAALVAQYAPEFAGRGVAPPSEALEDHAYYQELARLPKVPEGLLEALHGIEVMATDQGRERLSRAIQAGQLSVERRPESTHADFAARVWLAQPELFTQQQEEMRITGLTSFEYYASAEPKDRSATFTPPDEATLQEMRRRIDNWLERHCSREERVTDIEVFPMEGEWVFLIRRGDVCKRLPTVEGARVTMRHFRPARDLVAAYSPQRDELRLHGRSAREKQLIREVIGLCVFGDLRRFPARRLFTLEPLREDGPDALTAPAGCGIEKIVLRGVKVFSEKNGRWIEKMDEDSELAEVPEAVRLMRAVFHLHFTGQRRPRPVHIRAGRVLRLSRHCDATAVHRWLTERGFRQTGHEGDPLREMRRKENDEMSEKGFWYWLDSAPVSGARYEWNRRLGTNFDRVATAVLRCTDREATWAPCPHECCSGHRLVPVRHGGSGFVGVCDDDEVSCDNLTLTAEEAMRWKMDFQRFGRAVAKALGLDARDLEMGSKRCRQIGTFSGAALPVVLALPESGADFQQMVTEVFVRLREHFIVLAPTGRFKNVVSLGLLKAAKAGFFDLGSLLALEPDGRLRPLRSVGELFSPYVPERREPVSDDEARRLFALLKALESEADYRKAPVTRVFQLYCLEGQTREQVAVKCRCAPSLVTLRLQAIEKKLGRKASELRQLSGHIERIAESLTDERARRVYRTGALDEPEDPEFS